MPPGRLASFGNPASRNRVVAWADPSARPADRDDRLAPVELVRAIDQFAQRDEERAGDAAQRSVELVFLAHIENLHVAQMLLDPFGRNFPDAREGQG